MFKSIMALTSVLALGAGTAFAQESSQSGNAQDNQTQNGPASMSGSRDLEKIPLHEFDLSQMDNKWTADQLRDAEVFGQNGEEIGEVEEIILGSDDTIKKIFVESGGFLDIGDVIVSVAWEDVDLTKGEPGIKVPVSEENVKDFSIFEGWEADLQDEREYRAYELIGDYVTLDGRAPYGYVRDLIFNDQGDLAAVLVVPDAAYGPAGYYAYPYYGYRAGPGFEPGADRYEMPYTAEEAGGIEPYPYEETDEVL